MKISNEMATNLTLDISHAKGPLKDLTAEVKTANSEWKVQEAQLKAAGDAVGASKAKYDGLNRTVSEQKDKVEALKQSLANNNTETTKGRELQAYLTNELAKAERQLNSYNGQLNKAEEAYKYQSSGLAKVNNDLSHNTELTEANVRQLKAEGNESEANKVKLAGLTKTRDSLNKILKIQTDELDKLASTGDKNSEAYKKQELRVAQMSAKVAEANKDIKELNERNIKPKTSGIDSVKEKLDSMNSKVKETNSRFRDMLGAQLVATGIINAFSSIRSHITGVVSAGADYNKTMQGIQSSFDTFTNGNQKLNKQLTDNVVAIKNTSGYAENVGAAMTKAAYGVNQNQDSIKKLTNSFGVLGRAYGKNDDSMAASVKMFQQMSSTGKITSGSISKMDKQFKGFGNQLAKTMGVSRTQLDNFAKSGKISMQDVANAMNSLAATKPLALDNYYKTFDGFTNHFESRYKELSGKITAGFFNNSNTMLASLSKSLDGKQVDDAFSRLGDSVNKAANTIFGSFSKTFKTGKNPVVTFADDASKGIEKFGNFIANHAKDIQNFFEMVKDLGKAGFGTMGATLKIVLPILESLGKFAKNHPKAFKALAVAILGFNLALKGTIGVLGGMKKASDAFKFGKGLFVKVDEKTNEKELTKLGSAVKKTFTGIWSATKAIGRGLKWTAKLAWSGVKKSLSLIGKAAKGVGKGLKWTAKMAWSGVKKSLSLIGKAAKGVGKGLKWTAKIATNVAKKALTGLLSVGKMVGRGLKTAFEFAKSNPLLMIVSVIGLVIGALTELYQHNAKFRKFVNGMFKAVQEFIAPIGDFFSGIMKGIWDVISTYLGFVVKFWSTVWKGISTVASGIWNGISSFISGAIHGISSTISNVLSGISGTWKEVWGGISSFFGGLWDGIVNTVEKAIDKIKSVINGVKDVVGGIGKSIGKMIPHFARGGIVSQGDQVVMVNDGDGQDYKELIQLPNGKMTMTNQRNALIPLPIGTRIYSGEDTKQIMNRHGIKNYAKGGVVGGGNTYDIVNNYHPSTIIPISGVESSEGYELLNRSANSFSQPSSQPVQASNGDGAKLDQIITLLAMILGVNKEQLNSGHPSNNNALTALYQQMSRDNSMRKYQSI
ncbi:Phage-related protein [Fructobacillus evanidus]|uniref:Phage-related protein n=1 Tax=Fructobacillus evanidus TaxID=3064281 RepID=A0ABN9Z262_9LACO|nr:Phage-related protein [Fructobacillus sp. LMG 32999]